MNRHDRRAARKLSRDATDDEIFGAGIAGHGPTQPRAEVAMRRIMERSRRMRCAGAAAATWPHRRT